MWRLKKMKNTIQVTGIGQCGNRIGQEFENIGADTAYINSDEVDLRGFNVIPSRILMISTTGTGGSPLKGKEILEKNMDKYSTFMTARMDPAKLQLFVVGGGGGTGGGFICPAVKYAKEKGFKVIVLFTLPPKILGPLAEENALKVLKELKTIESTGLVLVDNELMGQTVGLGSEWWKKVNQTIASNFKDVFEIIRTGKQSNTGLGSIDKAEIMRIIQAGKGEMDIRTVYLDPADFKKEDDTELKKRLFAPSMIEGYDYKTTLSYLISVDVPTKGSYTEEAKRIFTVAQKACGTAMSRPGMFADPMLYGSIKVTMVNTGLKLPKSLQNRMNSLKKDEVKFKTKLKAEEKYDLGEMGSGFMSDDSFDF